MVVNAFNPSSGEQYQASQSYTVRPCFKKQTVKPVDIFNYIFKEYVKNV